jgi:DNA-binding Lrp family transcriptional regulator
MAKAKKGAAKPPREKKAEAKPWDEVDDYFLRGNAATMTAEDIAGKLGRTPEEVKHRVGILGVRGGLQGFATQLDKKGGVSVVMMTGARSLSDDAASGALPKELGGTGVKETGGEEFLAQFNDCVRRGN